MATENKCPHCGKPVPITALGGICPECMLKAGVAADTAEVGPDGTVIVKPPLSAPPVEEITPHFPQLEIIECLGRGGMGVVYKARQPKLDRFVALKILTRSQDSGISDTEFAARFQREALALARLNHPDIVAVYDFGEAGGFHYLLMEYVDGLTLRQLLQTRKLSPEEALAIVPKICEALQFAHERGIVHRDIKPENILLDKQGRVKIADFGIAKIIGTGVAGHALTGAKDRLGTPHYMAPEQVEKPATVDHRADIYSLGVVFYEMLTGELPLGKFQSPSRMVQVDVRLDEVVLHALEKNPDRRYQHASEVKTDVETIASSPSSSRGEETPKPETRNPMPRIGGAVGASAVLFGILAVAVLLGWQASDRSFSLPGALGAVAAVTVVVVGSGVWLVSTLVRWLGRPVTSTANASQEARRPVTPQNIFNWVTAGRWTARIFGTLLLVFFGTFIVAEGLPPIASQPEGVQLNFVALGLMLAGFGVGWKREGAAALLIALGWTMWQVSEGRMRWNLFQTPLPVAMLYGYCWWASRGRNKNVLLPMLMAVAVALPVLTMTARLPVHFLAPIAVLCLLAVTVARVKVVARAAEPSAGAKMTTDAWIVMVAALLLAGGILTLGLVQKAGVPRPSQPASGAAMVPTGRASAEAAFARVPPVVAETFPESGATDVDPSLTELRVTFSKPMQDGSWSWTIWGEENFPEMTGQPHFLADGRTCVLPVKLKPGKLYATWLNSDYHQDFKDRAGQSALPYLLIFETRK